ncbi:MAG: 3-hydroxyacyl-ACP dehydratase FabZ [Rickettsiales bacterium]|nr:3-hydroxyacyl-ACP dehydratase FabZ [Pseudomonadota bacterium]MDA0966502.1 3-hydroxyacyl-ACP dehydratase FabZ [Pseudomonadota bacterium]MDG4543364.1 3-hydroxyacyl-ACP dehydratase FabZ [Rickettsiales bacterium]MDG4545630.1 3-hydroxyacyl-ACP dehydratase FabZ [Rickettsiales bacterium]MDG4548079.1 3-hydroxyacyl-ACP dehydratase FabZ [Rickettsiales bacterium]
MTQSKETIVGIEEIIQMIPHRYPILLIDRIVSFTPDDSMVALKNVTFNEPHFMGHFPDKPIMPGVLIVEAIAQASAVFTVKTLGDEAKGKLVYFMSIDDAKFRKPVVPGDSLYLEVKKLQNRKSVWKFSGVATVEGKKVAEATVTAMLMDPNE